MRRSRFRNLSPMLALSLLLWTWAVAAQAPSLDEARRLLREGQIDQALVVIEQRLADDDSDRHARFLKGVALAEKPDLDAAIETLRLWPATIHSYRSRITTSLSCMPPKVNTRVHETHCYKPSIRTRVTQPHMRTSATFTPRWPGSLTRAH